MEHGTTSHIRAECVLVTGVRLSRMTEPRDSEEWWELASTMKERILLARHAWEQLDNFVPLVLKEIKRRKKSTQPKSIADAPCVQDPVSEVRIKFPYHQFY